MKILVTGSGGREHALAWKAAQSRGVEKVFVAPGNAGTQLEEKLENVAIDVMDFESLAEFAAENSVDLTIIGPENPLVAGVVDYFGERKLRCFGPTKLAARLEGSKSFSKDFLKRHGIPTADYGSFDDYDEAAAFVREMGAPIVIKADGLAAGKGVVIASTIDEALATIADMLSGNAFGEAGERVIVEEFLSGEEASFIVIADGDNVLPFASSQDHKAVYEGDKGPNTGGMGAYSPAPVVTEAVHDRILADVIQPTIDGMKKEGNSYTGFLYAGLMIDPDGLPKVIEYNCRFGDPETQPIMLRMQSDLVQLCNLALDGRLAGSTIDFDSNVALTVVLAAGGYPLDYSKADPISGLPAEQDATEKVFHAGTLGTNGKIVTNGGRVLGVTALGKSVTEAQSKAYSVTERISWDKIYYRRDIGYRAVARERRER
jgi:phosphoribosylamine--glycine ligase|tara:strand:+ start:252 stop:1544 length:1293 start_codon:yes stop_codon:yes gene_type:complete